MRIDGRVHGSGNATQRAWFEAYEAGRKLNSEQALRLADEAVSALEEELQRRSPGLTAREVEVLQLIADG